MKRTDRICAMLICAVLWFNPVGAQQLTKQFAGGSTVARMDQIIPKMERVSDAQGSVTANVQVIGEKKPGIGAGNLSVDFDNRALTERQKLDMVKDYMQQAFAAAPKAGDAAGQTHVFVGGSSRNHDMIKAVYVDGVRTALSTCGFPYASGGTRLHPYWGTWTGSVYEGIWAAGNSIVGYFTFDPFTQQATQLTQAYLTGDQGGMISDACAYDYSSGKVYTLKNGYTADYTAVDSIVFYSADKGTAVFGKAFRIDISTANIPVAMAIDKTGKFYIICTDGKVYSVKKENDTYSLEEIGDTKQPTATYNQSAAWDYRSDKIYWANINETGNAGYMSVWDPAEKDTSVQLGALTQTMALASVYFVDENPEAAELALAYDGTNVIARFTAPEYTRNGDPLAELGSAEIYKSGSTSLSLAKTVNNPVPGQKYTEEIAVAETEGTLTYVLQFKNKAGKASPISMAEVRLINVQLPYTNGFEEDESGKMENITLEDLDGLGGCGRVRDTAHTGSYGYRLTSDYYYDEDRLLKIEGLSVRQGTGYQISFWYKATSTNCVDVYADGSLIGYSDVAEADGWVRFEALYAVDATGQMAVWIGAEDAENPMYIDDIEIKEVIPPDVPGYATFNSVAAATDGSLKAVVNMTLPAKTMGDGTLSGIDSVEFYLGTVSGTRVTWNPTPSNAVKTGLTPGATLDLEAEVPKAGQYCLRAKLYNGYGASLKYSSYADADGYLLISPWIGSDMPTSVTAAAEPQADGSVRLTWGKPKASHDGYIGTVSYKLKDAAGTDLYSGSDTTFTTAALTTGMHTFTLEFANAWESKSRSVRTLAGIRDGMIYSNVSVSETTESRVLNVSRTADNSAFAQMIYPATGKAMYIDTLLLFTTAPTTGEAKQFTKIYMGTTDSAAFGGSTASPAKDFVEKENLTLVFADTLRFKAGENTLRLPLQGFYYDGTKTLVMNVVKPMQPGTTFAAAAYVAVSDGNMLKYRSTSTSVDFDTVSRYNDYTGTPSGYSVSMVAAPNTNLKTARITVKWQNPEDNTVSAPVAGVSVRIFKPDTVAGKNLDVTVLTGDDGVATFECLPDGKFFVVARKAAYIASQPQELNVATASPVEMEIFIERAAIRKAGGKVVDKGGKALADVAVKADDGVFAAQTTTGQDGRYELDIYGSSEYDLAFEKAGMRPYAMKLGLEEKDTVLADVEMRYDPVPVPMASVAVEDGKAVVKWNKPAASAMMSWVGTVTQIRRLTIDNKTAFKYAQRFTPEDLAALKLGAQPKALRFGFVAGSETAHYSIVLAADTTHEIYRQEVPMDKLRMGEWCNIDIPADKAAIDLTKELWLIVEVAESEDQGYACAATTVGTVAGKGNLMCYQNKWYTINQLFENGAGNMLIRLLVEDASTQIEAANGYRVYRGLLQDDFEDYTLLTQENVKATTYTDADYSGLAFGQYNYAVVADFYGEDLAEPAYTNTLNKDMEFTVSFKVTSNAGSAKGAAVYMVDTGMTRDYEAVVDAEGNALITKKVWRDAYEYEVSLPYHRVVEGVLHLSSDTVLSIKLEEVIVNPELTAEVQGLDVVVNYGVNLHNWSDDVESYDDFAISGVDPWILSEAVAKGGVEGTTWSHSRDPQSWIVMNPSKTQPALSWAPYSGDRYFAAMYNPKAQNNDYLIHPVTKGGGMFTFFVRAVNSQYPESFELVYSTTTSDLNAFQTLPGSTVASFTATNWARGRFTIPENARFIGIHCISNNAFGLLVDDLSYQTEELANPTGYELYLDGVKVKDAAATELTYTFKDLSVGEHKVGVKAIYASGASELVEQTVKVSAEAMPINLKATVEESTAVLTWDMPEGFAPQSYKVFLGNEQKAENLTEKTYTFSDLANGTYTASVVAVYETGESEKASVEFTVNVVVGVEDFDMAPRTKVYPNPSDGLFYLQAAGKGVAEVYTMNGQIIRRMEIPAEGVYTIDLQNRAKGMYLIRFVNNEQSSFFKVVVR
ncbi:MAG: choice-of-anchor J domain-containing protein [Bacteroides sp.]|nr:choice-of-anchor J domain-containing protein [Ruminococcus flavefaciens]MCM1555098.1 choice-of-anchor J domain-containing protein [Bacteroides sp.]